MRNIKTLLATLFFAALSGCGDEVVVQRMKAQPAVVEESKKIEDITDELANFKPPFPDRVALFEPENSSKSPTKETVAAADSSHETEPEVEVVGFGAVDTQHALLMIDGRLEALRVGEGYRNVHVLEIAPPRVQFRVAGRVRNAKMDSEQGG
jgi:hypothetical protein